MNQAPKLRHVPIKPGEKSNSIDEKKLELIKLKREAEIYLSKIRDKLKDKKVLKKAALIIEEMIKSGREESKK